MYSWEKKGGDLMIEICKHFKAETYISGEGAANYIDKESFNNNNIKMSDYVGTSKLPGLSSLHTIFVEEKEKISDLIRNAVVSIDKE